MKNFLRTQQEWITTIFRLGFGGFLLYAGGIKAFDPASSANATAAYKILPTDLAHTFGYILPWFEVALAIFLILGIFIRPSAIASALLMLMFVGAIASVWARGMLIDCGCLGGGGAIDPSKATEARIAYAVDIMRDLAFVGMCLYIFKYPYGKFSLDKKPDTRTESSEEVK
ncbi:MAG: DoxX family protein [Candidatus Planktophila sp.]